MKEEKNTQGCMPAKTPPMVLNEVSRLCMTLLHKMSGDDQNGSKQHSSRLILMKLAREDGIPQCELVKDSRMTAPTISVALKSLEQEGLVERRGDSDDMRAVRVYLTEKGREADRMNRRRIECVDEIMMSGFSDEEKQNLMEILLKMKENLMKELNSKNEVD